MIKNMNKYYGFLSLKFSRMKFLITLFLFFDIINAIKLRSFDENEGHTEVLYDNSDDNLLSTTSIKASQKDIETFS